MAVVELDLRDVRLGKFPAICIYCGDRATQTCNKAFHGTTPSSVFWTWRRPQVAMPVCSRHRRFSLLRSLWVLPTLVPMLLLMALLAQLDARDGPPAALAFLMPLKPFLVVGVCLFVLAGLVSVRFVFYGDIHCTRMTRISVTLAGVSERFAEAYYDFRDDQEVLDVIPAVTPVKKRP